MPAVKEIQTRVCGGDFGIPYLTIYMPGRKARYQSEGLLVIYLNVFSESSKTILIKIFNRCRTSFFPNTKKDDW